MFYKGWGYENNSRGFPYFLVNCHFSNLYLPEDFLVKKLKLNLKCYFDKLVNY